jgi:hypothetical protein
LGPKQRNWDAKLAREQVQIILDHQLPSGGFVDVVWEKAGVVDAFGNPPTLPWVCMIMDRSEAYWRGPAWANTSFMALKGLKRQG